MVGTCQKNKNVHPATPVMTEAAKLKAGILSVQQLWLTFYKSKANWHPLNVKVDGNFTNTKVGS